jgi:hypothetical protein
MFWFWGGGIIFILDLEAAIRSLFFAFSVPIVALERESPFRL